MLSDKELQDLIKCKQKSTLPLPNHLGLKLKKLTISPHTQNCISPKATDSLNCPVTTDSDIRPCTQNQKSSKPGMNAKLESVKMLSSTILHQLYQHQGQLIFKQTLKINTSLQILPTCQTTKCPLVSMPNGILRKKRVVRQREVLRRKSILLLTLLTGSE